MTGCTPFDGLMLRFTVAQIEPWIYEDRRNDIELHYLCFLGSGSSKICSLYSHLHPSWLLSLIPLCQSMKNLFFFFFPFKVHQNCATPYCSTGPCHCFFSPGLLLSFVYSLFSTQSTQVPEPCFYNCSYIMLLQSSSAPCSVSLGPAHLSTMTSLTLISYWVYYHLTIFKTYNPTVVLKQMYQYASALGIHRLFLLPRMIILQVFVCPTPSPPLDLYLRCHVLT